MLEVNRSDVGTCTTIADVVGDSLCKLALFRSYVARTTGETRQRWLDAHRAEAADLRAIQRGTYNWGINIVPHIRWAS